MSNKRRVVKEQLWPQYNFAYMLINKNACNSILHALIKLLGEYEKGYLLDLEDRDKYIALAVIRNPLQRVLSVYSQKIMRKKMTKGLFRNGFRPNMQFDLYIRNIIETDNYKIDKHLIGQFFRLSDNNDILIPTDIFKLEELTKTDFTQLKEIMKIIYNKQKIKKIEHMKRTKYRKKTRTRQLLLTSKLNVYDLIYERYKDDYEQFGYDKDSINTI